MRTTITELLGIKYPILQGGMQWVGRYQLAAAISNAGGLGMISALTQPTPEDLLKEISRCRELTDMPFGVNLTILPSVKSHPYAEYMDAIIAGSVKIVETAGRSPKELVRKLKGNGIRIIHKCTSVRHALTAEKMGVDAIIMDGFECAGHPGEDDIPGLVLIPAAVDALDIPVIAAGGIADGRGMAAALVLGAEGVTMGTRFLCTKEAPVHENIKMALAGACERDTILILRKLKNTARVFKNEVSLDVSRIESQHVSLNFSDIHSFVSGERGRAMLESGSVQDGILSAGLAIGLINEIQQCEDVIRMMVDDCRARLDMTCSFFEHDYETT